MLQYKINDEATIARVLSITPPPSLRDTRIFSSIDACFVCDSSLINNSINNSIFRFTLHLAPHNRCRVQITISLYIIFFPIFYNNSPYIQNLIQSARSLAANARLGLVR